MSDALILLSTTWIVGATITGTCVRYCVLAWRLWRTGVSTTGIVIDNLRTESDSGVKYRPVIQYCDQQGNLLKSTPFVGTDNKRPVGERMQVLYFIHKPKIMYPHNGIALVMTLLSNWLLMVVGVNFLVVAVVASLDILLAGS
ncbi:hypothetical protein V1L54_27330 [Streptomyces sp. TRM 70361]|uniref:hypothetical protein n=1 Tax=Streptomyces sp. TRM 70361 TaxID=3116553 RepID=UPI002E7B435D|nr:hypothetical protein [Streptomyces sp. TRM 70361]MEE1943074.1 hypothetical protein [Streptomyces sp. TRM 70361]